MEGWHDSSAPAKRTGRTNRAARPDAPECGAEEKSRAAPVGMTMLGVGTWRMGPLRSLLRRSE